MLSGYSNGIRTLLSSDNYFRGIKLFKQHLPKLSLIPIAVLTSTLISSISSKAYAQSTQFEFKKLPEGYTQEILKQSLPYKTTDSPFDAMQNVFATTSKIIEWFKHIPENVTALTTGITSDIYSLISSLILKTPLWLFDNEWFGNTTYLFSIVAVGIVSTLTIIEGMKRKFNKKYVDIKTIAKRWFIVAGLSTIVPFLFYQAFRLLNYVSETIIEMSSSHIGNPLNDSLAIFDILVLAAFNITLIILAIPILLKNARRFFDILVLGIVSPLAGVAYIFDSHKHLFRQWWSSLKQLSMVQVIYAFYLMIIGLFIYGVPTPDDVVGVGIKLLLVIGGFMRLINPPTFIQRQLDPGDTITSSLKNDYIKSKKKLGQLVNTSIQTIRNPINAVKFLSQSNSPTVSNTRMGRRHGK